MMNGNNFDPYSRGNNGGNGLNNLSRKENMIYGNDPYARKDPYAQNDPYARKDPFGNVMREESEKERFSFFWFWIKREIQLLFNVEAGAQDQHLIFPIEEDFMKLRIATKFFTRNLISFFLTLTSYWVMFVILGQMGEKLGQLKFIFSMLYFFIILYLLFLPTHQIVSSFEYTIFNNVKMFYKRVATLFSSYRNSIIFALILNIVIGGIFLYNPDLLHIVFKKNNHIIEFFKKDNVKSAYILLTGINIFIIILYIFFYKSIFKIAKKNREEHIKSYKKRKSEFYKYTSSLDED